ncbi:hypothetical protein CPB86DRAFT_253089 [Serendipita vermifera]|nr:hypothetical protein CPB86DRAFT_253089 [Serendipita vermifera]
MDIDSNPDFDSVSRADLFAMASFYLLTNPAIVPLHDGEVNRYHEAPYGVKPSSILRRASKTETKVQIIESILSRIRPEDRARVGELILLSRRKLMEGDDTTILTHVPGNEANNLVEDIIKKWDFKLWRPFPAGLERVKDMNGDWVVPELNL